MAAQNMVGGTGLTYSARPPAPPNDHAGAPAGRVAGFTEPATMDVTVGMRRISAEESEKRFANGMCLYSGGFTYTTADLAARNTTQMLKVAGADIK
jgi:hypothetical protein